MSKIQQIINELEEFIDGCRFQPLSNTKIVVNKDELMDFISELRQNIPEEVRKYQRIIANREAIIRDAQDKAEEMIRKANEMTSTLVSEHEIMQQAFREADVVMEEATNRANAIIDNATAEANDIRVSAIQYTDDSLGNIQNILNTAIEGMTVKHDAVMRSLESSLEVATKDRASLREFFNKSRSMDFEQDADPQAGMNADVPDTDIQVSNYIENTYTPEVNAVQEDYSGMTIEDALNTSGNDQAASSDADDTGYDPTGDLKDFDLTFDQVD